MSDYVRKKSIFYPIDKHLAEKLNDELEKPFEIEGMDDGTKINRYLCYNLFHTYGEESGSFGTSRLLTKEEGELYIQLFSDYLNNVNPNKFKYVDYCYYNCCECKDYYVSEPDKPICSDGYKQEEKHSKYWNDVLVQASIAAMQGIQESGHMLSVAADVMPNELANLSVKIAKSLVSKLKEEIGE